MINKIKHLWQDHKALLIAFIIVSAVTIYLLSRAILGAFHFNDQADRPIEPWMPLGFIAKSYHVPPDILLDAAGIPIGRSIRKRVRMVAEETGVPYEQLIEQLMAAIQLHRLENPPR